MSEKTNDIEISTTCPYCGVSTNVSATMDKDLDFIWDGTAQCTECGKLFVFVARATAKTYTVNMPDKWLKNA